MHLRIQQKGQSLLEILFAAAIFTMSVATIGYLVLDASASIRRNTEALQARLLAGEGIEAVRALRDEDFGNLEPGTYGIAWNGSGWDLSEESDQTGIFARQVVILERSEDVREVRVEESWGNEAREREIILTTLVSDWQRPAEDAEKLSVDAGGAHTSESFDSLLGVLLENTSSESVVIEAIRMEWDSGALLEGVQFNASSIFNASTSPVASIAYMDIDDLEIGAASGQLPFDSFDFSESIAGAEFILTLICADESEYEIIITL